MKKIKITWQVQDKSVLRMNPIELLRYSTKLSSNRPKDEPWVATIKPTTLEQKNYIISLSLDAYHKYTEDILKEFKSECKKILSMCEPEEIEEMKIEEIEKGNTGELYQADEGILRLLIPSRLLNMSKIAIELAFQRTYGNIVKKESSD